MTKLYVFPEVQAQEELVYNGDTWFSYEVADLPKGKIHYYGTNSEVCNR